MMIYDPTGLIQAFVEKPGFGEIRVSQVQNSLFRVNQALGGTSSIADFDPRSLKV